MEKYSTPAFLWLVSTLLAQCILQKRHSNLAYKTKAVPHY